MIQTAKYSDIGGREKNEDCCGIFCEGNAVCAVVADGLGGHGGGELASARAVSVIESRFHENPAEMPEFAEWFQKANEGVREIQTDVCEMKTTLTVVWSNGAQSRFAHVGDTRIYHFENGRIVSITFDHSVSQIAVVRGEITQDEIRHHVDRSRLLRAVGSLDEVNTEVSEILDTSAGEHAFLLCTDGFWEYVLEADMEETLSVSDSPADWLRRMRERLLTRVPGNHDNNTAAAIWIKEKRRKSEEES
ncbi:MAG: protein phosphatase 2C domain-containing protein [bacterium]|nr:protein phosphatase 2C domain-containing protein [bacterium]